MEGLLFFHALLFTRKEDSLNLVVCLPAVRLMNQSLKSMALLGFTSAIGASVENKQRFLVAKKIPVPMVRKVDRDTVCLRARAATEFSALRHHRPGWFGTPAFIVISVLSASPLEHTLPGSASGCIIASRDTYSRVPRVLATTRQEYVRASIIEH
jgi:hypothetical protein